MAEERDGEQVDYVFAGDRRVARLGGKKPVPVAAGVTRWLGAVPGALAVLVALAFASGLAAAMARRGRRWARPAVALATALAFLGATTAGCAPGAAPKVGPLAAVYYHGDHLGGVALQTDEGGALLGEAAYDPYGETLAGTTEPYGFTGKELDGESGLYEFGARLYDPAVGLFLSPDPAVVGDPELGLSDPQLLQPYAYVRNSPTGHVDPDGRMPHVLAGALAGGVIGGGVYLAQAAVTGSFSARGLAAATAGGAVTGAFAAATGGASLLAQGSAGGALAAKLATGVALSGMAGGITERAIATGSLSKASDPQALARDAAGAMAGYAVGKGAAKLVEKVAPAVKAGIAKAARAVQVFRTGAGDAIRYGPMNPGPLPEAIANTFRSGSYTGSTLGEATMLYRVHGGNAGPLGGFWTRTPPTGPLQSQIDLALRPVWGNTATKVTQIKVPAGTTIYEGAAAAQGGLVGGGSQVFIPRVDSSWVVQ